MTHEENKNKSRRLEFERDYQKAASCRQLYRLRERWDAEYIGKRKNDVCENCKRKRREHIGSYCFINKPVIRRNYKHFFKPGDFEYICQKAIAKKNSKD